MTRILKSVGAVLAALAVCVPSVVAQDKISPVSDYQFKKDYAQFENIKKEPDVQKRAELLIAFMKERPISKALSYVATEYMEAVKPHIQSKSWAKVIAMEEAFIALMPTEKKVADEAVPEPGAGEFLKGVLAPTMKSMQSGLMAAYYQSGNFPKAAEIGERLNAAAPSKEMSVTLADIYLRMQNFDKYLEVGSKVLADYPLDQSYGTALQMAQVYLQKQDAVKARELYVKVMEVYGDKVPPGVQEAAWNQTRAVAYSLMASNAYAQKDYPKAVELYTKVTTYMPKVDEAWFYIGMSKWRAQDPEGAIEAFVRCEVIGKTNAAKATGYLEQLWKARHNNTLDGLDAVRAKAKAELGIN
jgi:tetratricopeptide (TPR) repeat protein